MIKIKIKSRLKEAREAPGLDYGVYIHTAGKDFSLYLVDLAATHEYIQKYKNKHGYLEEQKVDPDLFYSFVKGTDDASNPSPPVIGFIDAKDQNTPEEPCMKALDVAYTAIHESRSGQGIGKLIYKLAMANAAKSGRPLMPDRLHVEPAAAGIWNSFLNDPSITKTFDRTGRPVSKSDDVHDEESASFFDVDQPKKTKMKLDDCSSAEDAPYGAPLNRAYYSDKMLPQLQSYINNFKSFSSANFSGTSGVSEGLYKVAHAIFRRRF